MRRSIGAARQLAVFITIVAFATPLVLNRFIWLDYGRYVWVINQPGRCAYLGSGALFLSVSVQAWLISLTAFVALILMRRARQRLVPSVGLIAASAVVALAAFLALTQPQIVASLLGCSR